VARSRYGVQLLSHLSCVSLVRVTMKQPALEHSQYTKSMATMSNPSPILPLSSFSVERSDILLLLDDTVRSCVVRLD
jgi:hypothetical protein